MDDLFTISDGTPDPPSSREESISDDAPYGYKADGTPYKRRPNKTGRQASGKAKSASKQQTVADAVTSLFSGVVAILTMLARLFKSTPLLADAIVVSKSAPKTIPPLTKVVAQNDRLVEMCQRLVTVTPGFELAAALIPLMGMILANHGMVPNSESQAEDIVKAWEKEVAESQSEPV